MLYCMPPCTYFFSGGVSRQRVESEGHLACCTNKTMSSLYVQSHLLLYCVDNKCGLCEVEGQQHSTAVYTKSCFVWLFCGFPLVLINCISIINKYSYLY